MLKYTKLGFRCFLLCSLSVCAFVACAARGYTIESTQKAQVTQGMTMNQVRSVLGNPYDTNKFRALPGPTWTYQLAGEPEKVFDVDFGSDSKVVSTSERYNPVGANDDATRIRQ